MYKIELLQEASRNLARLDKVTARRIVRKLNWLAQNAESLTPKGLRGNLAGFAKLREGDYRIIYEVAHSERIVIVRFIGHRSQVYKER